MSQGRGVAQPLGELQGRGGALPLAVSRGRGVTLSLGESQGRGSSTGCVTGGEGRSSVSEGVSE